MFENADKWHWLVVGLGNPGRQYERTRHNLGFMLVDLLAGRHQTRVGREECKALVGRTLIAGESVELVKPQTFMNLSGDSVKCLLSKAGRRIENLIVISDDLALPFGSIRIRPKGTHGGQNGLRSIIERTGTQEFIRLRIGIMPEHPISDASRFVLEEFTRREAAELPELLDRAGEAIETILRDGVDVAMQKFN
ncbi:MAG: aminoacyl-tRNA hydrolase [Acidobacteria bacterium ACB1]|nr:Peptidyl-tRNA hydrolase [Pyrinomonadaceae bacterium]MCE7962404.1 aminoacyl-tRNA hydrolase [Acidobacteria bacterium ACB1]RIJ88545.1 MAG: aminoacyl-tRNA hydrolase [Acidobacteriota bacterium]